MNVRTEILRLWNNPEISRLIGELAGQQRLAYNWAVDVLNREPRLPARTGKKTPDSLSGRCGAIRRANPTRWNAPFFIHQAGYEQAHLANERFAKDRADRMARVEAAETDGETPKRRDVRPHRRTLAHRRRKEQRSLTVNSHYHIYRFCVCGYRYNPTSVRRCGKCGSTELDRRRFALKGHLDTTFEARSDLPDNVRSIRFVETGKHRTNAPLAARRYCLHVSAEYPDPAPPDLSAAELDDIIGLDDGVKNRWTTSDGQHYQFAEPYPRRNLPQIRQHLAHKPKRSRRRRKIERRELERSRRRNAERARQFNHHARHILSVNRPAAVAIENKRVSNMTRSAKGTAENPGRQVKAKSSLNRSLQDAMLKELFRLPRMRTGVPYYALRWQRVMRVAPYADGSSAVGFTNHAMRRGIRPGE